jgi:ATP-dependent RNA helicase DDX47/RRP3
MTVPRGDSTTDHPSDIDAVEIDQEVSDTQNHSEMVVPSSFSSSPPPATASFLELGLCAPLVNVCVHQLSWTAPTPIQEQVIPFAIAGYDIIALAQTGSGKTGAFLLPILHNLLRTPPSSQQKQRKNTPTPPPSSSSSSSPPSNFSFASTRPGPKALILTPTRELAFQIYQVGRAMNGGGGGTSSSSSSSSLSTSASSIGATFCCVVGGVDRTAQAIALMQHPHVIIATPGRFVDHLKDTKGFTIAHSLQYLVLDEADRMLSMDFEQELHTILDSISATTTAAATTSLTNTPQRQTMLFSATMTSQVQKLQRVSLRPGQNTKRIEVSTKFQTPTTLLQYYLFIPAKYKDCYLTYIINEHVGKSMIIFGATCSNVQRIAIMLRNLNYNAMALHGQMNQNSRINVLQKFMAGHRNIMICTDVASRGLDIPNVDLVINYDLPNHGKEYIHRVGRTARAGKSGQAISMVTQYDVEVYQRIEFLLGYQLPSYTDHTNLKEETVLILYERVNEAQRLATRELKEQLANVKSHHGLRKRRTGTTSQQHDNDDDGGDGNGAAMEHEIKKKYKSSFGTGGSAGNGGALPNQRGGSGSKSKQQHAHRSNSHRRK